MKATARNLRGAEIENIRKGYIKKKLLLPFNYCNWLAAFSSASRRSRTVRTVGDMVEAPARTGPGEGGAELALSLIHI